MPRNLSPDDVRARDIAAMGDELGSVFTVLTGDFTLLSRQYQELRELYPGPSPRLEVMNNSAPFFFWMVQRTWWHDMLLGVTLLLAPPKSMGNLNLTIRLLPALVQDPSLQTVLEQRIEHVLTKAEFAKEWRDKLLAHRDLDYSLNQAAWPLPPANLDLIGEVLDDVGDILNEVQSHYLQSTTAYRSSPISDGVTELLYKLRDALRFHDGREKRLQSGETRPDDWDDDESAL